MVLIRAKGNKPKKQDTEPNNPYKYYAGGRGAVFYWKENTPRNILSKIDTRKAIFIYSKVAFSLHAFFRWKKKALATQSRKKKRSHYLRGDK